MKKGLALLVCIFLALMAALIFAKSRPGPTSELKIDDPFQLTYAAVVSSWLEGSDR
ncbi:MAG: hypothetical protein AAGA12_01715 [Pseudomonadota bacterium]